MKSILVFALLWSSASPAVAELTRIGAAAAVSGKISAVSQGAPVGRVISSGKPLFLNDHVTSGPNSRLQVLLLDQTVFTLGPDSDMVLDEFVYDPKTNTGKVTASITKGVFRFVTGKVAGSNPKDMKVKVPTATIGIRGTIVFGSVDGDHAVIGLGGPGFNNNTGDRYGGIDVSNEHGSSDISKPGWGTTVDSGKPPTPPGPLPPGTLDKISGALNPPGSNAGGSSGGSSGGTAGSGSAGEVTGQNSATTNGSANSTSGQASLGQALNSTSSQANQDATAAAASNVTDFAQFASVPGSGQYQASGVFTQTLCSGSPCSNVGTWDYNFTVNFAGASASGSASISAGSISDSASINQTFPGSGPANFNATSTYGTYNFTFMNGSGGAPAATVQGTSSFDNGSDKGTGAKVTAAMAPVNNNN
jgi:hypothetical protein